MGGLEVLFWIAIIIFSLLRGARANKKRPQTTSTSSTGNNGVDPLQEAIREIEAALRGEPLPSQDTQKGSSSPARTKDPIPEIPSSKQTYEPEFHSMESSIPSRELESKTIFAERYSEKYLEKTTTYEDSFRTTGYFDDTFKHAHPIRKTEDPEKEKKPVQTEHPLKKRLKTKGGLAEAIVLQTILTRRSFPPRSNLP